MAVMQSIGFEAEEFALGIDMTPVVVAAVLDIVAVAVALDTVASFEEKYAENVVFQLLQQEIQS